MYEYVNDVLRAKGIDPEDVILIRHTDTRRNGEWRFRNARAAGYIKEFTATQEHDFAINKSHLMVFVEEKKGEGTFYALYRIKNRYSTRIGHAPADYPNKREVEEAGDYIVLEDESLPDGISSFKIDWGARRFDLRADRKERPLKEIVP